ncbi:unnamed protein product [Protopolystoma xenopodis]|uniref:Uncharacterized protein n=1 Tax=Protopolystoma xenopodis TaxID=117903 RepID=A0A448XRP3_9PLAT|nr:unnamed protein product [Protopolystoma xenopodis]
MRQQAETIANEPGLCALNWSSKYLHVVSNVWINYLAITGELGESAWIIAAEQALQFARIFLSHSLSAREFGRGKLRSFLGGESKETLTQVRFYSI